MTINEYGKINRNWIIFLIAVIFFQAFCYGYFSFNKQSMGIDEIFTLNINADGINYIGAYPQDIFISDNSFKDKFELKEENTFSYDKILNETLDDKVHPPIYYFFTHTIASAFIKSGISYRNIFFIFNIFCFVIMQIFLYVLMRMLSKSKKLATLIVLFVGFSSASFQMITFVRMYMLLMMLATVATYLICRYIIYKNEVLYKRIIILFSIAIIIFIGVLTQYYFLFYCIGTGLVFSILLVAKRRWGSLFSLAISFASGLIMAIFLHSHMIEQLLHNSEAIDFTTSEMRKKTIGQVFDVLTGNILSTPIPQIFANIILAIIIFICILGVVILIYNKSTLKREINMRMAIVSSIILASIAFFVLVHFASNIITLRYYVAVFPILFGSISILIAFVCKHFTRKKPKALKYLSNATVVLAIVFCIFNLYGFYTKTNNERQAIRNPIFLEQIQNPTLMVGKSEYLWLMRNAIYRASSANNAMLVDIDKLLSKDIFDKISHEWRGSNKKELVIYLALKTEDEKSGEKILQKLADKLGGKLIFVFDATELNERSYKIYKILTA